MTEAARRHLALFTLAGLMILAPVFWQYFRPVGGMMDIAGFPLGRDFINVWTGARLSTHSIATLFDYGAYYQALQDEFGRDVPFHNWGYPPSLLFFIQPLSWLPYGLALIAWTGLGLAIYLAVALRPLAREARMVALALLLLAPAT